MLGANRVPYRLYRLRCLQHGVDLRQNELSYRLIYRITGSQVIIYLIADGRRDMQSVLARRLLGA